MKASPGSIRCCYGRSRPFIQAVFPKLQEFFPQQLCDVTEEQFYRAVNKAQPSLIRIEADELTYCLHIMVRYEIEKQTYRRYAGRERCARRPGTGCTRSIWGWMCRTTSTGCLQDPHWSGGSFGYFPSYALGSAYGAQMLRNMEKEIDVWGPVSRGDLSGVSG